MPTLNWIGKDKVINHHLDVPIRTLKTEYTFSPDGSDDGNMIIHGDNLEALKALLPQYEGRVRCIYIDPPYNTGNENWIYNDNVNDPRIRKWLGQVVGKEGEDLSRHDKWLCMMYPRLRLLQKLLHPTDGVIFISIDENEYANLKLICNEIFGANSFVITIAWQKRYSRENRGSIGDSHEYILVYASDTERFKYTRNMLPLSEKQLKAYSNPDNDPRGLWQSVSLLAPGYRPNQMYQITAPNGKVHRPPDGRCWSLIEPEMRKLLADNRVTFGSDGNGVPRKKQFLSETPGLVPWSWWPFEEVGHTDEAKKEIKNIYGDITTFDTPKPTRLIERILQIATTPDSIILDSFAGSGTTAHAVLNMNKTDGGHRKFIMVEMGDYADSVTAERVKRAIEGYGEGNNTVDGTGGSFSFYELGEPLFLPDGSLNPEAPIEDIRAYVYFTETRKVIGDPCADDPYFLGLHENTAYYFCYDPNQQTVLSDSLLGKLHHRGEQYVIYADACAVSDEDLKRWNITFKKIPRDIVRF